MGEKRLAVGILGCGAIGSLLSRLISKKARRVFVAALWDRNEWKAHSLADSLPFRPLILPLPEMAGVCDLLVEAASQEGASEVAVVAAFYKKPAVILSVGAVLTHPEILELAKDGARLFFPSGAIAGLDAVKAAREDGLKAVTLTTRKPPRALEGAPFFQERSTDLSSLSEPTLIYEGPAREAVRLFPANVNVAATLSLAGLGPERTTVRIVVDPSLDRNVHEITLEGDFGKVEIKVQNVPCPENPKTSMLAALSALALIEQIAESVRVGT